jgi:hypothetical protein
MAKIRKTLRIEHKLNEYVNTIREKRNLNTFADSLNIIISEHKEKVGI